MADLIATVQPLIDGWEAGDFKPRAELFAPSLVLTGFTPTGDDRVQGAAAIARYLHEFFADWSEYRITAERVSELDDQHVFIEGRQHGIGRTSGIEIDETVFIVVRVEDGLVTAVHWHAYRDGALRNAGLEP